MTQLFPLLFTPFQLGKHTQKSRIVVTGQAANFFEAQRHPNQDYGYYLRERAKGGAELVTLGNPAVRPTATSFDDRIVPKYRRPAELVHEFPVPVMAQLGHPGRKAGPGQRLALEGKNQNLEVPTPIATAHHLIKAWATHR